ncbi:amino acid adenylation domain-containing protein [Vreelandella nigrificans]|uniref:Amino acid adenylation protein n=1 Tax=Vreelandella nigrificans TaxID=2042704 RepID=A0A2A4HFM1_9GAMM|nr:amino acid adenylation domain-containing protein [Halomonas nigrificans]PCF93918.1 amino acid adenylation protein [Halomonas nigrificans]
MLVTNLFVKRNNQYHSYDENVQHTTTLPTLLLSGLQVLRNDLAIVDDKTSYSYEDAVLRAINIAAALRRFGVGHNDCIGLFMDASADLPLSAWGILFAGAAYLPLSPEYPHERLSYMLKDARVKLVLSNHHSQSRLDELLLPGVKVCNIDDIPAASFEEIDSLVAEIYEQNDSDLAYVIYTSGTTGKPKGVAISQQAIVNQMRWISEEGYLDRGHRVLQKTPVSFDAAQWELLGMCCGACVVMAESGSYRDPEGLVRQIKQHEITTLQGVPTLWQALTELEEFTSCESLRSLFSGGEGLSRKLARQIIHLMPNTKLINLYGPTECTINATHFEVKKDKVKEDWEVVPIGRPVDGLSCHVLDSQLNAVKLGDTGELFISGSQLADGYLFRPEQTDERFVTVTVATSAESLRMYRTGDLVRQDYDGVLHFVGRVDNQVKFRGYRIELDEIRLAIENHSWVKSAAVFVAENTHSGHAQLVGAVELNPSEALLMDQDAAESHHQTKSTRVQIRAQLSGRGLRNDDSLMFMPQIVLKGKQESATQRARAFARKTYRFYHGGKVKHDDLLTLLGMEPPTGASKKLTELDAEKIGVLLRDLGQFSSEERLLPKFGYASPGALYATQLYVEIVGITGVPDGVHYYHPAKHSLYRMADADASGDMPRLKLHFVGNIPAIREVYKNNIREVLEMECGHMLGLLDYALPEYGYGIGSGQYAPSVLEKLSCPPEHDYLGSYDIVSLNERVNTLAVDVYLQAHQGRINGMPDGSYHYLDGKLVRISDFIVEQRHVIAINQQVYQRSSGGIAFISQSHEPWRNYIDVGRCLQRVQMNQIGIGTMSSGYSSKSGNPLATSLRLNDIVAAAGGQSGPSYFCLFGKISESQARHVGMDEDAVHMKGPAELIREDLLNQLPDYMVPGRIAIISRIPHSVSGKVDVNALKSSAEFQLVDIVRPHVEARDQVEAVISRIWRHVLGLESVSVVDDFFELGGNSIQAVAIAQAINREFKTSFPVQLIFTAPTVEKLAIAINEGDSLRSRAILLAGKRGGEAAIFCWPGLGGYPMNLRPLAEVVVESGDAGFYGIQSRGINSGEQAFASIEAMAAEDVQLIRSLQPKGPYRLWGYSFGARVAYETAWQLEQIGEPVSELVLLAPGSPKLPYTEPVSREQKVLFENPAFLTILLSVFAHDIEAELTSDCLASVRSRADFVSFIGSHFQAMDMALVEAILDVVSITYSPEYQIALLDKPLRCRVTVWRAAGDGPAFIDDGLEVGLQLDNNELEVSHYAILKSKGISELKAAGLIEPPKGVGHMPHVVINCFKADIPADSLDRLQQRITDLLQQELGCSQDVVSIDLMQIEKDNWREQVYQPMIESRASHLLRKPNY